VALLGIGSLQTLEKLAAVFINIRNKKRQQMLAF